MKGRNVQDEKIAFCDFPPPPSKKKALISLRFFWSWKNCFEWENNLIQVYREDLGSIKLY